MGSRLGLHRVSWFLGLATELAHFHVGTLNPPCGGDRGPHSRTCVLLWPISAASSPDVEDVMEAQIQSLVHGRHEGTASQGQT